MKTLRILLVAFLSLVTLSCSTIRQQLLEEEAQLRRDMIDQTVKVEATLSVIEPPLVSKFKQLLGEKSDGQNVVTSNCSGFVAAKSDGLFRKPRTLIVSANHCLNVGPGTVLDDGSLVTSVIFTVKDSVGRECSLTPILLGGDKADDVATGVADCDVGRVARLAPAVPQRQEEVYISGHPMGVYPGLITNGFYAGWYDGYLLTSAPAWGGNSGGPVYNTEGEVVGVMSRRSGSYSHMSMAAPLGEVKKKIEASGDWDSLGD
jgi:hypothetical protein